MWAQMIRETVTAHWAFDHVLFTISRQYELIVHKDAKLRSTRYFPILEATGKPLVLPDPFFDHILKRSNGIRKRGHKKKGSQKT
jgi:hypothetical protein